VRAGSQDVTPEGIHGMGGNVSEWVEDAFVGPFYAGCGDCVDPLQQPTAKPGDAVVARVIRGSGWANTLFLHSSGRARYEHDVVSSSLGVRCALSPPR
jgi:formylglycine-generating enzyme required for sulfatase activity